MMKKLFAVLLTVSLLLGLAACGTINNTNVAVLWSDGDTAVSPFSLINSMDRAMYLKNVGYDYYGAQNDQAKQLEQAKTALDGGCSVLLVELVEDSAAQQIIDLAKAKNVPVIFFNCTVAEDVLASYDKSYLVDTDATTLTTVQDEMIEAYMKSALDKGAIKNAIESILKKEIFDTPKDIDRNKDGKVTFVKLGQVETSIATGKEVYEKSKYVYEEVSMELKDLDPAKVEMIITADDKLAMDALIALQAKNFNTDQLSTQIVPIFTVNNDADYKAYVLQDAPTEEKAFAEYYKAHKAHFESNRCLVDFTVVEAKEVAAMIYTTVNVVDDGRIAGTTMADYDAIAESVAAITANLLNGKDAAKGIDNMNDRILQISYTAYAAK